MEKNLIQPSETIAHINKLLAATPEGDRVRVFSFVESIDKQRRGKRSQRTAQRVKPVDDSWRVGS